MPAMPISDNDQLQKFLFEDYAIRGELVHLDESYRTISKQHDYPVGLQQWLGEALAATALLIGTIKLRGKLSLQVKTAGDLNLLFAQGDEQLHLRGMALWTPGISDQFSELVYDGTLAINIQQDALSQPYQGIVSLQGDNLAQCIEAYFNQSEQLPTRLWLFANAHHASGLLLQKMPSKNEEQEAYWQHLCRLTETITGKELLTLSNEEILKRLYHQEELRLFESEALSFHCSCSREKLGDALRLIGFAEVDKMLEQDNQIKVQCDFCNKSFVFDKIDVTSLFKNDPLSTQNSDSQH